MVIVTGPYHVEEKDCKVEEERDYVKDKALLCPLLSEAQLDQADCVLKVVLYRLKEQSDKLSKIIFRRGAYLKPDDHIDFVHLFASEHEPFVERVGNREVSRNE